MITADTFKRALMSALKLILKISAYVIPSVLFIKILEYSGALDTIARACAPLMGFIGLPGDAAMAILLAQVSIYAGAGAVSALALTSTQLTIIALFMTIFHALPVETAIVARTGANPALVALLRFLAAVLVGVVLNLLL